MKRSKRARLACGLAPGLGLALALPGAFAQVAVGPIATQNLFFNQASNAQHGNYLDVDAGFIHTDNVLLEPGSRGDTLALLGLLGDLERVGPRLDYHLDSDISLVKYLHSEFQTQPFGYFNGQAELKIVPGLFAWVLGESFNQAILSPLAPVTPDNVESINYVTTGPRLTLRPTLRTAITVDGTYSYVDSSSKSPLYVNIDDHRYGGDITLRRDFSNTTGAYLTGSASKVEFTNTVINTDFTSYQGTAGLKYSDARTVFDVSGGYTRVHTADVAGLSHTPRGVTWDFDLSRLIQPTQRVSLHALRQVADAANLFFLNYAQPVPTAVATRITSGQPFTYTSYGASWRFEQDRTSFEIDAADTKSRYEATPTGNQDAKTVSALFARQLTPTLNWDIGASYQHVDYAVGAVLNTVDAITSLRWRLGERVGLRFIYARSTLTPHGYKDNQFGVIASYSLPLPGTAATPQGEKWQLQPLAPASSLQPLYQPPPP